MTCGRGEPGTERSRSRSARSWSTGWLARRGGRRHEQDVVERTNLPRPTPRDRSTWASRISAGDVAKLGSLDEDPLDAQRPELASDFRTTRCVKRSRHTGKLPASTGAVSQGCDLGRCLPSGRVPTSTLVEPRGGRYIREPTFKAGTPTSGHLLLLCADPGADPRAVFVSRAANLSNEKAPERGFSSKRMMGLEPTTFCMASRRSSQLSYIRTTTNHTRTGRTAQVWQ